MTIADRYEMYSNAQFVMQHYGEKHQLTKTLEEMCELGAELVRMINGDQRASMKNVLEEIADVEVMLLQIRLLYEGFGELPDVEEIMAAKLDRAVNSIPPMVIDVAGLDPLTDESIEPVLDSGEEQNTL